MNGPDPRRLHAPAPGVAGRIASAFIDSPLTPLIVVVSVLLGIAALWLLPREEEPQIRVPVIDVMVAMPGASAREVEQLATRPMEKLLWEIPGVEYVYSTSREGHSMVVVRFKVGEDMDAALVRLDTKLHSNYDRIPQGISTPLIKPKSIDDVPILALTLHGGGLDHYALRRLAAQVDEAVKQVPLVAETTLTGGARRQLRIQLDPSRLTSRNLTPTDVVERLAGANQQVIAGALRARDRELVIQAGAFLADARDAGELVLGVHGGRPIYLREVATIEDAAEEPTQYVFYGRGAASDGGVGSQEPAVTLSVAKRPGANAIDVTRDVLRKVEDLRGRLLPQGVAVDVTRNYGETAREKSDELLEHMGIAVLGVSVLILLTLGWRESLIVGLAIPCTLSLTLLVFYLYGYTLNRITLFALIFSIGILVDDAIVVVENVVRHFRLPGNQGRPRSVIAMEAVSEVGNPTILATFAVIAAVLPMAFVGGLMGPYMRPIPIGSSAAMVFSLAIAFIVTPWAAVRVLHRPRALPAGDATTADSHAHPEDFFTRLYRGTMGPLIAFRGARWLFLLVIVLLLLGAMATVGLGWVKVKMLPFDNKSEFQIILNMPEDATLERTAQAAADIAAAVRVEPEVTDYQVYVGTPAPFNFNGLVRHYFLRGGPHHADLQVNLLPKSQRAAKSHDIAHRVRPQVAAIAARYGARVAVAEVPPGPPVLQTLVAEIYGPDEASRAALAADVRDILKRTEGVVDVDWYVEADQPKDTLVVDREKAAQHGISTEAITRTLTLAVGGERAGRLHLPREREDVPIVVRLPQALRDRSASLLAVKVRGPDPNAPLVPLSELVRVEHGAVERSIHHKNLMPVTYVLGDVAGVIESPVYAILQMNEALATLNTKRYGGDGRPLEIYNAHLPFSDAQPAMKWDGEWHITIEVFRDLGSAFAVVLVLIYILMVGWFRSFVTPLVVMVAIPFSLVGILPAHGMLDAFFTATSMIGFMAGAGIVVRNSIILVDFIELRLAEGMPIAEAVVDAGAVRFRPMLLTALAVVVGASVILADPIFQGLAIALMAGEIASLLISRMAVPVLYYMVFARRHRAHGAVPATQTA